MGADKQSVEEANLLVAAPAPSSLRNFNRVAPELSKADSHSPLAVRFQQTNASELSEIQANDEGVRQRSESAVLRQMSTLAFASDFFSEVETLVHQTFQCERQNVEVELLEQALASMDSARGYQKSVVKKKMYSDIKNAGNNVMQDGSTVWPIDSENGCLSYTKMKYVRN